MAGTDYITAEAQRWRSHSIKSAYGTAEVRREEMKKPEFNIGKTKTAKRDLSIKWLCHRREENQESIIYKEKAKNRKRGECFVYRVAVPSLRFSAVPQAPLRLGGEINLCDRPRRKSLSDNKVNLQTQGTILDSGTGAGRMVSAKNRRRLCQGQ
jgi:hypothetical protein